MQHLKKLLLSFIAIAALAGGLSGGLLAATGGGGGNDVPITGPAYDQAIEVALAHTGGGTVTETELGDGNAAYEVEIRLDDGRQVEVELDANFNVIGSGPDDDGANDNDGSDGPADD